MERYNRQPQLIVDASAMSAVAVVTNSDGSPIDLAKARQIPVNLSDKFFVQSPTDHANRSTSQRVYAMLKGKLKLMMEANKSGGIPLSEVDSFLEPHWQWQPALLRSRSSTIVHEL